jgi:hypothetical protein
MKPLVILALLFGASSADDCQTICTLVGGACSSKGSYCKNGHACMDLFWFSDSMLCNSSVSGCNTDRPLLCSQATTIVRSSNSGGLTAATNGASASPSLATTTTQTVATTQRQSAVVVNPSVSGMKGITNLGATCYLASVLQILFHSRSVRETIAIAQSERRMRIFSTSVYNSFTDLLQQMNDPSSSGDLDMGRLLHWLHMFNNGNGFIYNQADDAYQSAMVLFNALSEASPLFSRLVELREGGVESCTLCGNLRQFNRNGHIQLVRIPDPTRPARLEDMLATHLSYTSREVKCQGACGGNTEHGVVPEITHAPRLAVLAINRYSYTQDKLLTSVEIPIEINIGPARYRLIGVVRHNNGHYTCDYFDGSRWVHADDARVGVVSGPITSGPQPSMVFYEQI